MSSCVNYLGEGSTFARVGCGQDLGKILKGIDLESAEFGMRGKWVEEWHVVVHDHHLHSPTTMKKKRRKEKRQHHIHTLLP